MYYVFSVCCVLTSCLVTASNTVDPSASVFSAFCPLWLASISQLESALVRKISQKLGLLCLPRLEQGRPSATTSMGLSSSCQLQTQDALDSRLTGFRVRVRVRVTVRLAVYHQLVRFGAKSLEAQDYRYFATEPLRIWSLCNIFSDEGMGFLL
jgi:hypothetical protein